MHGRIGHAFERTVRRQARTARGSDRCSVIISAWARSSAKGAHYLRAAGDRARMIYANDDALRFYQQALAALGRRTSRRRSAGAGRADRRSVRPGRPPRDRAGPLRDGAAARIRDAGDRVAAARILRKIGRLLWDAGKRDKAEARYAEAAAFSKAPMRRSSRRICWQERGRLAFRNGDHAQAAKWADEALGYARARCHRASMPRWRARPRW